MLSVELPTAESNELGAVKPRRPKASCDAQRPYTVRCFETADSERNQSYKRSSGQRETTSPREQRRVARGTKTKKKQEKNRDTFKVQQKAKNTKRWRQQLIQICVHINWHRQGIPRLSEALKTSARTEEQHPDIEKVSAKGSWKWCPDSKVRTARTSNNI